MSVDFSQGKIWKNIIYQTIPMMVAQLVQLLYNVVDRVFIGHIEGIGSMALTGVGLAFPLTTLIAAFTSLFGTGGTPLFSIARGAKEEEKAEKILGEVTGLLIISSVILFVACYSFRKPILYAFGASDNSFGYADEYLKIYLIGTPFTMLATGLNGFINAQGFPKLGMVTIVMGALLNLILDPIFIYAAGWGIRGAATATIISQFISCLWVLCFFAGKKTAYRIKLSNMKPRWAQMKEIMSLGAAGFIMQSTNCLVQVSCNATLRTYGGDLYVAIMTVINSVREIMALPANSISSGSQPVLGYNYGAKKYARVRQGIRFTITVGILYTIMAWVFVVCCPRFLMGLFTTSPEILMHGPEALKMYFRGFCFMAFMFAGQSTFVALKHPKQAIFFSLLRKVIIVVPLTLLLPKVGFGVMGVFMAEPISNVIGGLASFITMWLTLYRKLPKEDVI